MNKNTLQRCIVTAILAFCLGQIFAFFLAQWLNGIFPQWYSSIQIVLVLLVMWFVVTSAMRYMQTLHHRTTTKQLLVAGIAVTLGGMLLYWLFLAIYGTLSIGWEVLTLPLELFLLHIGLGVVITLITLVNLKIVDKALGSIVKAFLMIGVLMLVLYLSQ